MNVQVEYALTAVSAFVDYHSVAILCDSLLLSNDCHNFHEVAEESCMSIFRLAYSCKTVPVFWDHQEMNRSYRIYVSKSQTKVIFVDNFSRDLLAYNPVKNRDFLFFRGLGRRFFVRPY